MAQIYDIFDTANFMRRWDCGGPAAWGNGQGWFNIVSDLGVFGAYMAIPVVLLYFILKRRDVPFSGIFWLFAAFIFACGTTHLIEAMLFWWPAYRLAGAVKFLTAVISWLTVWALVPAVPKALALPGLAKVNAELKGEIDQRHKAEQDLKELNETLEQRVASRTATLLETRRQLGSLTAQITMTQQHERRRISRELHDNLAQLLAVSQMRLSMLGPADAQPTIIMQVTETLAKATQFTRTMMSELSPPMLYDVGLKEAIDWLARRMHADHGVAISVAGAHLDHAIDEDIATLAFESTRELLANVVKHAKAKSANVTVEQSAETLIITVTDNGVGFDPHAGTRESNDRGGLGLFSLKERFGQAGGKFQIHSAAGAGTSVTLSIPNARKAANFADLD